MHEIKLNVPSVLTVQEGVFDLNTYIRFNIQLYWLFKSTPEYYNLLTTNPCLLHVFILYMVKTAIYSTQNIVMLHD